MRIKKFEFTYGGYCATNYEVTKYWNKLLLKKWDYSPFENRPLIIKLNVDQWSAVVHQILDIVKDWNSIYESDTCDGIQWTLVVKTDTLKYDIYGSNNYPENFDSLLKVFRSISGLDKFAEGHNSNYD